MKRLMARLCITWMRMEIERCEQAAQEVITRQRELIHYQIKNQALLPESMRYTFRGLKKIP